MKKSSILLFGVAVVLVIVTLLVTRKSEDTGPKGLTIAGYASDADLAAEKQRKLLDGPLDIDHPIDEIVLERPDGVVHLVRDGAGKDATWNLTEPVDAVAVKYLVDKITGLFKTETASVFATRLKDGDLPLYDLEPERRIGLTLKSQGAVWGGVDLWIGRVEKADDAGGQGGGGDAAADTWVMAKGDAAVVYRLGGKDLREPAAEKLDNLRDKKAFTVKPEELTEVSVTAPDGRRFTLTGTKQEEPAPEPPPEGGEAPKPKPPTVVWALSEPAGVTADASASALARSFAGLRAKAFVPKAEAPATALSGEVWKLTAKTGDGKVIALTVQDGGKDDVWAQVDGRDELMQLAAYTADGVRKTVEDVMDKKILDVTPEQVTGVVFQGPAGAVAVSKRDGAWRFDEPALPYPADLATVLPSLTKVSCARWARPDEAAAARAALSAPGGVSAALTTASGTLRLTFSAKMDAEPYDGKRWGVVGDVATGAPFLAQDFVATRFEATPDKLREKKVTAGRAKSDLRSITVQLPGVAAPVVYESPPGGGEPTLASVPEGKTVDEGQVRTVVATASALAAKGFSDKSAKDAGLEGEGLTRVTLGFADGTTQAVVISASADGSDPFAMVDSGPLAGGVFTLNSYQVKNLQKHPDELVK
ncbi:MAG: hypothetical protein CVU56_08080 [Deltaproteobacteria bacterium HGW-Deltaproteobacteria-14]|nr:MAG: hypothetical protein CVU56_08080 [Deltaproteobacteria bacterium HGW-Deltaproteobacteria-14]